MFVYRNKLSGTKADCVQGEMKMKKRYQFLILLILYSLALGVRIYWLSQKNGFHVDEGSSVTIACYNTHWWYGGSYELNKTYTGKEAKELGLCNNASLKSAFGDIFRLWKDSRDGAHTNLYYSFLRLSLAGLKTGDIKLIIFRGGVLNLLFFTVSFIFFFLLTKLLFPDSKLLQFSVTICAFLSTATISNTLFLRPYQIQETMFIIFCYYFVKTFDSEKYVTHEDKLYINKKLMFFLSVITAITLMSGYYAVFFIGLFGLYVLKTKNYAEKIFYIRVLCIGLVLVHIFYPKYLRALGNSRTTDTINILFGDISANIKNSITFSVTVLHEHFLTYPIIIVCALLLLYLAYCKIRKQKLFIQIPALYVFLAAMLYFIIISIISFKILRYVMSIFPFFIILPAVMIKAIEKRSIAITAMTLLCICLLENATSRDKINYLYHDKPDYYSFSKDIALPVFVLTEHPITPRRFKYWEYADLVPYFNDEQIYYFIEKYEDIDLAQYKKYNEFYIVIRSTLLEMHNTELVQSIKHPGKISITRFKIEQEFKIDPYIEGNNNGLRIDYFTCKKIRRLNK